MSSKQERSKDRDELTALLKAIEPNRNEEIARRAVGIAAKWLTKAENQALMLTEYQRKMEGVPDAAQRWTRWNDARQQTG